jgi:hypothetical protein
MKAIEVLTAFISQPVQDKSRNAGPKPIFQIDQFLLVRFVLLPVNNPMKMHDIQ